MNILITGGASGLGGAITKLLASDSSHKVYFTFSRSEAKATQLMSEFPNAIAIKCDFKNKEDIERLTAQIASADIDALVNNAFTGEAVKSHFNKINPDDFLVDFQDNIMPAIIITQAAINVFRKKKSGKIITILTSFLVNTPPLGTASYVANKAYLQKLTQVWANENAKYNISSNTVSPSFMQTGLTADVDERLIEQMTESHPLKKLLTVDEAAEAVQFLISATSHINGIDILINGATNIK
jgi:3-oxoacyl-[acyl-carrier protein] reductase